MLDREQEEMDSAARVGQPRNTDSFDYARYHPINEVCAHILSDTDIKKSSSSSSSLIATELCGLRWLVCIYGRRFVFVSDLQFPGHAGGWKSQYGQQDCNWSELRGPST